MSEDTERLVVLLEARVRDFERNMQKASGTAGREFRQMRQDARTATSQMEADMDRSTRSMGQSLAAFTTRAGALARSFAPIAAGGAAGGAALAGFVATARSTAREIATIGDEARRAGISVKAFQELKFVADQNRVSVEALTDGMKELSLRADEFIVTGSGSAAEAFKRLGFRADELKVKLRDPSALFTEIIGKLQQLDKAAQIRIADELFGGTGGEQFVQLIGQGEAGIRRMIQQANDLGLVMDEKMIDKAAEIDRRFGIITQTIGVRLKGAIVEAADALRGFFDYWNETQDQQDRTLQDRLGAIFEERQALMDRIAEMQAQDADPLSIFKNTNELKIAEVRLAELTAEAGRLKDILDQRNGLPGLGQDVVELGEVVVPAGEALDAYGQSLVDLRARLQGNVDGLRLTADTFGQTAGAIAAARFEATAMAEALRAATAAGKEGVDADTAKFIRERAAEYGALTDQVERNTAAERERQRAIDEGEAQRKRVLGLEEDIAFERSIMFLPEREQQIRTTLRGVGVEFETFEGQRLAAGLRYNGALEEQREALTRTQDFLSNILSTTLDIFNVDQVDSWGDRFLKVAADIGRQFQQLANQRFMEMLFGGAVNYTTGVPSPGQRSIAPAGFPAGNTQTAPVLAVERRALPDLTRATSQLAAAAKAIRTIESGSAGGNYQAIGPTTRTGDRALGAYQIMGNNLPEWSRAAIGREIGRTEFLRSIELQDKIFEHRFGGYMAKYGAEGASRAWFAGEGGMRNYRAQDVVGTSVGGYGSRFGQLFAQHGGGSANDNRVPVAPVQMPASDPWANLRTVTPGSNVVGAPSAAGSWFGQGGRISEFMQSPGAQLGLQAIGAFGTGYSSGSMGGGALSGALPALMMGNPVGAVIGGISGPVGGTFGGREKRR